MTVTFQRYTRSMRQGEIGARLIVDASYLALQVFLWWRVFEIRHFRNPTPDALHAMYRRMYPETYK